MMRLYGAGASRWVKPYWLLKELDVPFEAVSVKLSAGEHRKPEFLRLNPFGKVPALVDGDFCVYESSAICNYIADKFSDEGLIPEAGTLERAIHDQWTSFATTELEQPLWRIVKHRYIYPEEKRSVDEIDLAKADFANLCATLEKELPGDHLVGKHFSVADIVMTYTLKWATLPAVGANLVAPYAKLSRYLGKHLARPKFPHDLYPKG